MAKSLMEFLMHDKGKINLTKLANYALATGEEFDDLVEALENRDENAACDIIDSLY